MSEVPPYLPYENLPVHPDFPALPAQASNITRDAGCAGCPLTTIHPSCNTFTLQNLPVVSKQQRVNLRHLEKLQAALSRRAFDHNGIIASEDADYWWYRWNAANQLNFSYFGGYNILGTGTDADGNPTIRLGINAFDTTVKEMTESTWRKRPPESPYSFWLSGYYTTCAPSPNMMIEFQYPSAAYRTLTARVIRVVSATDTELILGVDKDCSICTTTRLNDPEIETFTGLYHTVKMFHYGRMEEQWEYVRPAHHFFGAFRRKIIEAANVPEDGIWVLENGPIATPKSVDDFYPNFVMEGMDFDGVWHDLGQTDTRLFIRSAKGAYPGVALYCFGFNQPVGSIRSPLSEISLVTAYQRFRATYYAQSTEEDSDCVITGFDRCFHAMDDYSKSASAYNADYGVGQTANGVSVYCDERIYEVHTETDERNDSVKPSVAGTDGILDTVTVTQHSPTFIKEFPTDTGACTALGFCNKYEDAMERLQDRNAFYSQDHRLPRILKNMIFSTDCRLVEPYVSANIYTTDRVGVPSIFYLNGYYGTLSSPQGWHQDIYFKGHGAWGRPVIYALPNNAGQGLETAMGFEKRNSGSAMLLAGYDLNARAPMPETLGLPYRNKLDPLLLNGVIESDMLELIGARIERDTGLITGGRGMTQSSHVIGAEDLLCPSIDLSLTDIQLKSRVTFHKPDYASDAVLQILPLRQPLKQEVNIGQRTAFSKAPEAAGVFLITCENEYKSWSRLDTGEVGDSYDSFDKIFSVAAGGGPVILPYEWQEIDSYHREDKTTGSRYGGLAPGDCMEITIAGVMYRFLVISCEPHGGLEADDWKNKRFVLKGTIDSYWSFPLITNEMTAEQKAEYLPLSIAYINNVTEGVNLSFVNQPDKPVLLHNQCWYDGGGRIYFSSLNDADTICIFANKAQDLLLDPIPPPVAYDHFPTATRLINLNLPYAEYQAASTKTFTITRPNPALAGEVLIIPLTLVTTVPTAGQVWVSENAITNTLQLELNIDDDSPVTEVKIVLDYLTNTPAPDADPKNNNWSRAGVYVSFGKKRDIFRVLDEGGILANADITGATMTFYQSATVAYPQITLALDWMFRADTGGDWLPVPAANVKTNLAAGRVTIAKEFFDQFRVPFIEGNPIQPEELEGTICFNLRNIALFDHRANIPASLLNKLELMVDKLEWVTTNLTGGTVAIQYGESLVQYWDIPFDPITGCTGPNPIPQAVTHTFGYSGGGNVSSVNYGDPLGTSQGGNTFNGAGITFSAFSYGLPQLFRNLPDEVTIGQCLAEITCGGITRKYRRYMTEMYNCEDPEDIAQVGSFEDEPATTTGANYSIVGIISETEFETLGSVGGALNATQVVDITGMMQLMWADRSVKKYKGFAVILVPSMYTVGVAASLPTAPPHVTTRSGECYGTCGEYHAFNEWRDEIVTWTNASVGQIKIRLNYNGTDKQGWIAPKLPSMQNIIEPLGDPA